MAEPTQSNTDGLSQPVGFPVLSGPAPQPNRVTLNGKSVTLKPLRSGDAADLYTSIGGEENRMTWTYIPDGPYTSFEEFESSIIAKSKSEDPLFFVVIDTKDDKPVGHAALMRIDARFRSVEVGNIIYSPSVQRSTITTEVIYLLAKYVFEELGYRRFEWKCDNLNGPSKRAAIRFGFSFEGIFRQHMIYKERNRDTAWFSIIDSEWPAVKNGFETWLHESNFDDDGKQRYRLEEVRSASEHSRGPVRLEL